MIDKTEIKDITMGLQFCSLSSGSSGNCYIIKSENTALLVDAGISGKRIFEGMAALGIADEMLKGLLITHEHIDHVKSVRIVTKKKEFADVYASGGTWSAITENVPVARQRTVFPGCRFAVGDIEVMPFRLSHDAAEPVGYTFSSGGDKIGIVTDTGIVTDEIHNEIKDSDILVLEANHDVHTLQFCNYPYSVKRRIIGEFGHLSNEAAAEALCRICRDRERDGEGRAKFVQVILAHLSKENNFPEMAYQTVRNVLEENGIYIGDGVSIDIIERDVISPIFVTSHRKV